MEGQPVFQQVHVHPSIGSKAIESTGNFFKSHIRVECFRSHTIIGGMAKPAAQMQPTTVIWALLPDVISEGFFIPLGTTTRKLLGSKGMPVSSKLKMHQVHFECHTGPTCTQEHQSTHSDPQERHL